MKTTPPLSPPQLPLALPDTPAPSEAIWEALDPATKQAALHALARLLAGTVRRLDPQEPAHD